MRPRPALRRLMHLSWVLGARLSQVRTRRGAGELSALSARELLTLLRALFEHAALQSDEDARAFVRALEDEDRATADEKADADQLTADAWDASEDAWEDAAPVTGTRTREAILPEKLPRFW